MRSNKGEKGQVAIIGILGLLAAIMIGGVFAVGSIQSLLEYIVDNFWTFLILLIGIGAVGVFLTNSYQDKPKWRMDLIGGGILIVAIILLVFLPSITGTIYGYKADANVKIHNPIFADSKIQSIEINNFEKVGPLNLMRSPKVLGLWPEDNIDIEITTTCNDEKVDEAPASLSIGEGGTERKTVKIHHLPGNAYCTSKIVLYEDGKKVDEDTKRFRVASG